MLSSAEAVISFGQMRSDVFIINGYFIPLPPLDTGVIKQPDRTMHLSVCVSVSPFFTFYI